MNFSYEKFLKPLVPGEKTIRVYDRLAMSKLKQLNRKHNLNLEIPKYRYLGIKDTSKLKIYIEEIKKEIRLANLRDIKSINEYLLEKYTDLN